MAKPDLIHIIDDDAVVQRLLNALLVRSGYRTLQSYCGLEGMEAVVRENPDLILLDIMMPNLDGFQVIEQLKLNPETVDIPVIFLSAKVDPADKVRGIELGAADFVNKPFDQPELMARIRAHLKIRRQDEALREYSENLEKMVEERTRQLTHADRLASLGTLSAGMAHEINNPLTFILGNVQTLETFWPSLAAVLEQGPPLGDDPKVQYIVKEFPRMFHSIRMGAERIVDIVYGLKAYARKAPPAKAFTEVEASLTEAFNLTNNKIKHHITVEKDLPDDLPMIWANRQQLVQVFVNLILNAVDAIGNKDGRLRIEGRPKGEGMLELRIGDNGTGIPAEVLPMIFDPFFTTKPLGEGTGLGLSITQGIIKDQGGTIEIVSEPGVGSTFIITLPTEPTK